VVKEATWSAKGEIMKSKKQTAVVREDLEVDIPGDVDLPIRLSMHSASTIDALIECWG
jgi:hypothetical protein